MNGWIYGLILLQLAYVSWVDIQTKKISNSWLIINLVLALGLSFIFPDLYPWEWGRLLFPVGWVVVGFLLFILNVMGAGDSKYLAGLFLIIPSIFQMEMLEKLVVSSLVVGLVMLIFKIIKDFQKIKAYAFSTYWQGLKDSIRSSFSFAPVILLAWLIFGVQLWS